MSSVSSAVSTAAAGTDWNVIAAAAATFVFTSVTVLWGWITGKKKVAKQIEDGVSSPVASAVIMDTKSVNELVVVLREVRDQVLLLNNAIGKNTASIEDNIAAVEDIEAAVKRVIKTLSKPD